MSILMSFHSMHFWLFLTISFCSVGNVIHGFIYAKQMLLLLYCNVLLMYCSYKNSIHDWCFKYKTLGQAR